jgi:heterodisulfide reductase subunit A-like polyferredoxin
MSDIKVGVFLSHAGKQLTQILDFDALTSFVKNIPGVTLVESSSEFWRGD